jgi:HEAT repeat protein
MVLEKGAMLGGKGLPDDLTTLRMKGGQIVKPEAVQNVEALLELVEDMEDQELDPYAFADELRLDDDPTKRRSQLARLRRLLSHENYLVRLNSVKALASVRDLDNVSGLVYALSDPDPRVSKAALDGLRFLSRKLDSPSLPAEPSAAQVRSVQDYWNQWYLSIRPDGETME